MAYLIHDFVFVQIYVVPKFILVDTQIHLKHLSENRRNANKDQYLTYFLLKMLAIDIYQILFDIRESQLKYVCYLLKGVHQSLFWRQFTLAARASQCVNLRK